MKKIIVIAAIIAIGAGAYFLFKKDKTQAYDFVVAGYGNLEQTVSVTGRVKPEKSIGYAFDKNGRVAGVRVKPGDRVLKNSVLATLANSETSAQLRQAQAGVEVAKAQKTQVEENLKSQEARLEELENGTRSEERRIAEVKVENARTALLNAQRNLDSVLNKTEVDSQNVYGDIREVLQDAYMKAEDALDRQVSALISGPETGNPQMSFYVINQQAEIDAEWLRMVAAEALKNFKAELARDSGNLNQYCGFSSDCRATDESLVKAEEYLLVIRTFLERLSGALYYATGVSEATLNTYKNSLASARANLNAALTSVGNQRQAIAAQSSASPSGIIAAETRIDEAKSALAAAEEDLNLKAAGARREQVSAQKAQVRALEAAVSAQKAQIVQAQANVQTIRAQFEKTVLTSSISGIVTRTEIEEGEAASVNVPVVFVISDGEFKLETFISEADIAKVQIGNWAKITLDAYGSDVEFSAEVAAIDPAETMVEGVATYKTTLKFDGQDERIRSGMTANIDILAAQVQGVISVPYRAVLAKDGRKIVRALDLENNMREIEVETGLRGSDGNIEIVSGVQEGDKIVVFVQED